MTKLPSSQKQPPNARHNQIIPHRAQNHFDFSEQPRGWIKTFVRHRTSANLLMVLLIIAGLFSIMRINTQFFPTIEINSVTVTIAWPGASADDISRNVLAIVEPTIRFLEGVDDVISYAREGAGTIRLEFASGTDMQEAERNVEEALDSITTLPEEAEAPQISTPRFFDRVARISISGPFSETALRTYAKRIRDELLSRGIDQVTFSGLRDPEILIELQERDLRRLNLTVADISASIRNNSQDRPSGTLDTAIERQLRVLSGTPEINRLRKLSVRALPSGETIRLQDIGRLRTSFNPNQVQGLSQGQSAIQLTIEQSPSVDTLETARILNDYLAELRPQLPQSLNLQVYDVRAEFLQERIMLLVKNGLSGLVLVLAILFVFLNARVAFWVAVGIPVAMLATLAVLFALGQTINMISLFALIMMLGIIVDDAIVVAEHTETRFRSGENPALAAENGARRMLIPVMAASLTTIAAFAPIFLVSGTIGTIMQVLPVVAIAVLVASLVECFLILPNHLAHGLNHNPSRQRWSYWRIIFMALTVMISFILLQRLPASGVLNTIQSSLSAWPPIFVIMVFATVALILAAIFEVLFYQLSQRDRSQPHPFRQWFDNGFAWFREYPFRFMVTLAYNARYVTVAIAVSSFILAIAFVMSGRVGFSYFPSPESENINAFVEFNAGIPKEEATAKLAVLEQTLFEVEAKLANKGDLIQSSFITLGAAGNSRGDNVARIRIQLTPSELRDVRTVEIIRAWRQAAPQLAGLKRFSIAQTRGGPPGRDIDIHLHGENLMDLKAAAQDIIELLNSFPGVSGAADDLPYGKPELVMRLNERGVNLGFSIEQIGQQIRNAFEGTIPRRFAQGDDEITIRVRQNMEAEGSVALRQFELRAQNGDFVPLSEVVDLSEEQGFATIIRRDGRTTISVTADVNDEINTSGAIVAELNQGLLPDIAARFGLEFSFSGRAEEQSQSFADLRLGTLIALSVIYIILAWVFASYARPLAVMLIIPFGFVGAVFGHYVLGFNLTILSLIGLLGLSGILVNDSIILVSRLDERLKMGNRVADAAINASCDRLRAVLLTSLTTIGGLTPLLFENSLQAQFLLPMAITMVFGLAFATLLVLFLVPALIGIGHDLYQAWRFIFQSAQTKPVS